MDPKQLTVLKFGAVFVALLGGFLLVGFGKLDAGQMYSQTTTLVGALVVALGIANAGATVGQTTGNAVASTVRAHLASLGSLGPVSAPDEVKRGTGPGKNLAGAAVLILSLAGAGAAMRALPACTPAEQQAVSTVSTVLQPGIDFLTCLWNTIDNDEAKSVGPPQIVVDVLHSCGGDAQSIATVLDAEARHNPTGPKTASYQAVALAAHQAAAAADAGH